MSIRRLLNLILVAGVLAMSPALLRAQGVTTAAISGTVTDDKGEALEGATVKAIHVPSGSVYGAYANNKGRFNMPNMRVGGPYTVEVSYTGNKTIKDENIYLELGQSLNLDYKLKEDNITTEEVVITANNDPVMNASRTGAATNISSAQLRQLPTISRGLNDYLRLNPQFGGNSSFAGRNPQYNNTTIDGALFNNAFGLQPNVGSQTSAQPYSLDAVEQIQISIAPYDVRQGSFTGAGINAVTRSGTNDIEGSVYGFYRDQNLTGDRVNHAQLVRANSTNYIFGVRIGAPIIKDKLFYFVSYEGERITSPVTSFTARPSTANPAASNESIADAQTLDLIRSKLIRNFGYDPGVYQGYDRKTSSDKIAIKLDWNIHQDHKLSFKYNFLRSFADIDPSGSGTIPGGRGPGVDGLPFSNAFYRINNDLNSFILELNSSFGSMFSNNFTIGYTAFRDYRNKPFEGGPRDPFPLVDVANPANSNRYFTSFGFEPFSYNNILSTNVLQFSNNFTAYLGKHSITIGTQNEFNSFTNGFSPQFGGRYVFSSPQRLLDHLDSLHAGRPTTTNTANGTGPGGQPAFTMTHSNVPGEQFPLAKITAISLGFYIQDEFSPMKGLKITAGVRTDIPIIISSITANPELANRPVRDGEVIDVSRLQKTTILWSPRVGFNWDVLGDRSLQIRGGTGIFSGRPPFVWLSNQASNTGLLFTNFTGGVPNLVPDANQIRPVGTGVAPTAKGSTTIAYTDPNFKYPQVWRTSLGADYKLKQGIILSFDASYTQDINAVYHQNVNLPYAQELTAGADVRPRWNRNILDSLYTGSNVGGAVKLNNSNKGYSYNLTGTVRYVGTKNLDMSLSYAFSDARSINDGGSIANSIWRDRPVASDPNADELGFSNYVVRHRIIASANYRFEYAKYFATTFGLVYNGQPGQPQSFRFRDSYTYFNDLNNDGLTNDLMYVPRDASEILLVNDGSRTPATQWAQLNAFIDQDPYLSTRRGQYAERNGIALPFVHRFDLRIMQDFLFNVKGRSNTIQISMDIQNVGNLINSEWGVEKFSFRPQPLTYVGRVSNSATGEVRANPTDANQAGATVTVSPAPVGAAVGTPVFRFPLVNGSVLDKSFEYSQSFGNTWRIQFGIRYIWGR